MRAHPRTTPALSALATLLVAALPLACSQPVTSVGISVVTSACSGALAADPQRDPTAGVATLHIKLSGDGISPVTVIAPYSANGASIPNVPLGTNRRVTVEAWSSSGLVRSRADSGPFDVTAVGDVQLNLFLRVVDAFVFTGSSAGTCSHMLTPRAGHQMSQLADGRVLITGGYNIDGAGALHYLTQAELYDPRDGTFANVGAPANFARAGHLSLPMTVNGLSQVLLFGGEGPDGSGALGPVGPFELYSAGVFSSISLPTSVPPRERAAMALDVKTGYAVLAGGANGPDVPNSGVTVYDVVSYFNPQQQTIVRVDEPLAQPLSDAVAVSRKNAATGGIAQGGIVLLGGRDMNGNASAQISGMKFFEQFHAYQDDATYETPAMSALPTPRLHHSAIVAADDSILVIGGNTSANDTYLLATDAVTVVDPTQALVVNASQTLSTARADGCAALLGSGQVLYAGGAWGDASGVHSTSSVDLIQPAGQSSVVRALEGPSAGSNWGLQAARHKAACLLLSDGTVLVTGGLQFQSSSGTPIALGSAEIYTPPSSQ